MESAESIQACVERFALEAIRRLQLKLEPVELVQLSLMTREELHEAIAKALEDDGAR